MVRFCHIAALLLICRILNRFLFLAVVDFFTLKFNSTTRSASDKRAVTINLTLVKCKEFEAYVAKKVLATAVTFFPRKEKGAVATRIFPSGIVFKTFAGLFIDFDPMGLLVFIVILWKSLCTDRIDSPEDPEEKQLFIVARFSSIFNDYSSTWCWLTLATKTGCFNWSSSLVAMSLRTMVLSSGRYIFLRQQSFLQS